MKINSVLITWMLIISVQWHKNAQITFIKFHTQYEDNDIYMIQKNNLFLFLFMCYFLDHTYDYGFHI